MSELFREWLRLELGNAGTDKEAQCEAGRRGARRFGRVTLDLFMAMPHAMRTAYSRALAR